MIYRFPEDPPPPAWKKLLINILKALGLKK